MYVVAVEEMMCVVCVCYRGSIVVMDVIWHRQVRQGIISSELLMCSGGVCSILLMFLVARCLETIDVSIWHMFVFMSVVVGVFGNVCCVAAVVEDSVF